jgi:hypothetical protein
MIGLTYRQPAAEEQQHRGGSSGSARSEPEEVRIRPAPRLLSPYGHWRKIRYLGMRLGDTATVVALYDMAGLPLVPPLGKEVALMRRILLLITVAAMMAAMLAAMAASAAATKPVVKEVLSRPMNLC